MQGRLFLGTNVAHRLTLCLLMLSLLMGLAAQAEERLSRGVVTAKDGVQIHYESRGSGAPALVFIHGWNCDRSYWSAQLPVFATTHQVVAIDLAGHGDSGINREDWSMANFGADVAAVADALKLKDIILVGHSMGGPVALEAARLLEGRVTMIIGADTLSDVSLRYPEAQLAGMLAAMAADFSGTVEGLVRSSFFLPTSDPAFIDQIAGDMSAAPPAAGIGAFAGFARWFDEDVEQTLANIDVPIRLINSDYRPTDTRAGQALTASFEATLMSGVGHFVMQEDPAQFNAIMAELLDH
ncbi:MAG: alpha/beta hydrolase [Gammaproteobacteria bacterium]|nr:alpha/beta hydrolase [Gammaproteobacteria bacterium]